MLLFKNKYLKNILVLKKINKIIKKLHLWDTYLSRNNYTIYTLESEG